MVVPPWLRPVLNEVNQRIGRPETVRELGERAGGWMNDLPDRAARGLDRLLREARQGADQVQQWAARRATLSIPVINATGRLIDSHSGAVPVAGAAIQAAAEVMHDFSGSDQEVADRIDGRLQRAVARWGHHRHALMAVSVEGAVMAVGATAARRGETCVVPRCQAIRTPSGVLLPDLLRAAGAEVVEIGAPDGVCPSDWKRLGQGTVVWVTADALGRAPERIAKPEEGPREMRRLHVALLASDGPLPLGAAVSMVTLEQLCEGDLDWVITPTDRLLGGPDGALLLGASTALDAVHGTVTWPAVVAPPSARAAATATLQLLGTDSDRRSVPVQRMLHTSVDNLRHRAERLAVQISAGEGIASCQITEAEASIAADCPARLPSRQLRIAHRTLDVASWARKLASAVPSVHVEADDQRIVVDLRWVEASADAVLAEQLGGRTDAGDAAAAPPLPENQAE